MYTVELSKAEGERVGVVLENAVLRRMVLVTHLKPESRLLGLGVRPGDVIKAINGTEVRDATHASKLIAESTELELRCCARPPVQSRVGKLSLLLVPLAALAIAWYSPGALSVAGRMQDTLTCVRGNTPSALEQQHTSEIASVERRLEQEKRKTEQERTRLESQISSLRTQLSEAQHELEAERSRGPSASAFDPSYGYDRFRIVELSLLLVAHLEAKPAAVDPSRIFSCIRAIQADWVGGWCAVANDFRFCPSPFLSAMPGLRMCYALPH